MILWSLAALALILLTRFLWRGYTHPQHTLVRQAANMNWVASRTTKDENGRRNTCVSRGGAEAMITFEPAEVVLLNPPAPMPFADFIELERWLVTSGNKIGASSVSSSESPFDPIILEEFEREIETWDPEEASAALKVVRSALTGDHGELDRFFGDLTVGHIETVVEVVRRIRGDEPE